MTAPATPPRPGQVTLAAWMIMLGSGLVVLTVFDRIAGLHSLESQEAVERFLATPPGSDLDLGVEGVLGVIRTLAMVAGGCATAAAILGYQVLQRSSSARVALSVLAVPLFLTGMVAGGFMSSVVVASAVMLWFPPARDWFRDGPVDAPPAAGPAPGAPRAPAVGPAPGAPRAHPVAAPGATYARPPGVTWACALTWVFSALAVVVMLASLVVLATSPDLVHDEVRRQNPQLEAQGVPFSLVVALTWVMGGVIVVWSLLAIGAAVLAFRGVPWARVALLVSASLAALLCLLATLGQLLMVVPLAACVMTVSMLLRPEVRAWFATPREGSGR